MELFHKHEKARRTRRSAAMMYRSAVEALEGRRLLAASAAALDAPDPDGTLRVSGTAGNDTIVVELDADVMRVTVNGATTEYDASNLLRLEVHALAGNDSVTVVEGHTASSLFGGPGNDTLIGSGNPDLLDGGSGTDRLEGRSHDDRFIAKDGEADQLFGGDGNNVASKDPQDQVLHVRSVEGDVNLDGSVNATDFSILAGNFGKTGVNHLQGDLTADGKVDSGDFALLAANFGKSAPRPGGGDPDESFGAGGKVTVPAPDVDAVDGGVGVTDLDHANGKTVLVGRMVTDQLREISFLVRLDDSGRLDPSFGQGGIVVTDFIREPYDILVQPDDKVALLDFRRQLVRFNADGSLDTSFGGGDGTVPMPLAGAVDLALAPGDKLVAGGGGGFAAARFLPNGDLDPSFGGDGVVGDGAGGFRGTGQAMAVQPDGKVVVAGVGNEDPGDTTTDATAVRWNADGTPDTSFGGGDGYVAVDLGSTLDSPYSVAIDASGRIVIGTSGGGAGGGEGGVLRPLRLTPTGAVDRIFDPVDLVTDDEDYFWSVLATETLIAPDGKVIVVGTSWSSIFAPPDRADAEEAFMARYNPDGTIDATFGGGLGYQHSLGTKADLMPDGRMLVANARGTEALDVARYLSAGASEEAPIRLGTDWLLVNGTNGGERIEVVRLPADPASGRPQDLVRVRDGLYQRVYTPAEVPRVQVEADAGDDRIFVSGYDLDALVSAGEGNDEVYTAGGHDSVNGYGGNDLIRTGAGNDVIRGEAGADDMSGGDGNDWVNYQGRSGGVRVHLANNLPDDGEAGEGDNARDDIENAIGGYGPDRFFGTPAANQFHGGAGNDELYGRGGSDRLYGDEGEDALHGDEGDDFLFGRDGTHDFLAGGFGTDTAEKDDEDTTNGVERFV